MSADFDKFREIFLAALEQAPEQRDAYLDQICAGDEELRRNVDVMLRAQAVGEGPLDRAAVRDEQTGAHEQMSETPGTVIGPYKLIEQIGEGGMGTVWMAQQTEPVKRLVAVKLIKAGMDSRQVIARFEAERQALALMDHANIARVLEAGTTAAGRPYFVMDLVKGVPITRYCDEHHLTPRQRLELFIPVCQAVQHAHQKGVIHRDLKPSNVLVALYDGKPVPKVIDFGVAKAAGQQLTDKTLVTGFGNIIGTLEYMSPEQAEINQLDIDTRSDIYSLGALLYELLAGSPPFSRKELEKAGMLEMLRVIREQEPTRPSTKLSTAYGLPTLAANRGTEPAKLTKLVRGELDWIVMKALEKDRTRRYETANGFAMDLHRYMADEPVLACPPSTQYQLRKFLRRNKGPVFASAAIFVLLVAGIVSTTWQAVRAWQAQKNAIAQRDAKDKALHAEQQALQAKQHALQAEQRAHRDAETASEEAGRNFHRARKAVDDYFTLVSDSTLLEVPGLHSLRQELLEAALRYHREFIADQGQHPELRVELAASYFRLAQVFHQTDRHDGAIAGLRQAIDLVAGLVRDKPQTPDFPKRLAGVFQGGQRRLHRGAPFIGASVAPDTIAAFEKAAGLWEQFVRDYPQVFEFQSDLAAIHDYLGELNRRGNKLLESLRHFEKARELCANVVKDAPARAERRAELSRACYNLGQRLGELGRSREAEDAYRQGLLLQEELVVDYPNVPYYQMMLGNLNLFLGDLFSDTQRRLAAEATYRQALSSYEKLRAEYPRMPAFREGTASAMLRLGGLLRTSGKQEEAEKRFREALAIYDELLAEFPGRAFYLRGRVGADVNLGLVLVATDRVNEADDAFRRLLQALRRNAQSSAQAWYYYNWAWTLAREPRLPPGGAVLAAELAKKAVELAPADTRYSIALGVAYYRARDWKAAIATLEDSLELRKGGDSTDRFFLAMAHWQLGEKDKASEWYDKAVEWMDKNQPRNEELRRFRAEAAELLELKEKK